MSLISKEIQVMINYFSTLGTQAALIGGFAFSLISAVTVSSGPFFFVASVSCSLLMITLVYSSVVGSRAATMGLTGARPSEIRHTVVLMRTDKRYVEITFYLGIVTLIMALCLDVAYRDIGLGWRVASAATLALLGGCGTLCVARRGHRRYRGSLANHAVVSGDEFLKIKQHDTLHAAAEAATEAAKRAPDE